MDEFIASHEDIVCPVCGKHDFTPIRKFNLVFQDRHRRRRDSSSTCYLRPETAQGIFVNFAKYPAHYSQKAAVRRMPGRQGLPATEITPGNFIFRIREFGQMECEFF